LRLNSGLAAFARLTESAIYSAWRLPPPVGGCIVLFAAVDAMELGYSFDGFFHLVSPFVCTA
jgi:hypothetical protein